LYDVIFRKTYSYLNVCLFSSSHLSSSYPLIHPIFHPSRHLLHYPFTLARLRYSGERRAVGNCRHTNQHFLVPGTCLQRPGLGPARTLSAAGDCVLRKLDGGMGWPMGLDPVRLRMDNVPLGGSRIERNLGWWCACLLITSSGKIIR
jgi:hypothetical protein